MSFDFKGRAVFVAGGTSGINLGIAEAFAQAGARVAVMSRSQAKVDDAQQKLRAHGGEVLSTAIHDSGGNAQCRDDQGLRFDLFRPKPGY